MTPAPFPAFIAPEPDQARAILTAEQIGIPPMYRGGFDTVTAPGSEALAAEAKHWAANFRRDRPEGIRFRGDCGTGKTHLACAIARSVAGMGYSVRFWKVVRLFMEMRQRFNAQEGCPTADDLVEDCLNYDLLVLDDLGAEEAKPWIISRLYLIVDGRYESLKPIIYTTNLNTDDLSARLGVDGQRITERLKAMCPALKKWNPKSPNMRPSL